MSTTVTTERSVLLDGADLHDGVRPGEDLRGLHQRVVVVAGDQERAASPVTSSAGNRPTYSLIQVSSRSARTR